jgi:plastocyanin
MQFTSLALTLLSMLSVSQAVDVQAVAVGKNPLNNVTAPKFWPEKITAAPGTMVQFQFWAGNHTVTQSSFDNPCVPIGASNSSAKGVKSGFQPITNEASIFTVMVTDSRPMWIYCGQGNHCKNGMVMVINENTSANSSRSLDGYKQLAAGVPAVSVPGAGAGAPGGGSGSTPGGGSGTLPGSGSDGGSGGIVGGGAGSGSGSGSPTGGSGAADPATTPPSAAGRTAISMGTLVLAFGASLFLL